MLSVEMISARIGIPARSVRVAQLLATVCTSIFLCRHWNNAERRAGEYKSFGVC